MQTMTSKKAQTNIHEVKRQAAPTNLFKLEYDSPYLDDYYYGIAFYDESEYSDVSEFVSHELPRILNEKNNDDTRDFKELFLSYIKATDKLDSMVKRFEENFVNGYDYEDWYYEYDDNDNKVLVIDEEEFQEELQSLMIDDLKEFMRDEFDLTELREIVEFYGIELNVVGYSNWSYCMCLPGQSEFADDIYNGYNFYHITQYNSNIEQYDSLGQCYVLNSKDLEEFIRTNFEFDNELPILLESNESSEYMKFKKFNVVPTKLSIELI